jgi:hypothetical protein
MGPWGPVFYEMFYKSSVLLMKNINLYTKVDLQCLQWRACLLGNVGCEEGSCQYYTNILQCVEEGRGHLVSAGGYQKVTEWTVNNQLTDGGRGGECDD